MDSSTRSTVGTAPSPPSLGMVMSTDSGDHWSNLTLLNVKCGATCNPHAVYSGGMLVLVFLSAGGMAVTRTADGSGMAGWSAPVLLTPYVGHEWMPSLPGPGAALAIPLPGTPEQGTPRVRMLFCAHNGDIHHLDWTHTEGKSAVVVLRALLS